MKIIVLLCTCMMLLSGCTTTYENECADGVAKLISARLYAFKSDQSSGNRSEVIKVAEAIRPAMEYNYWTVREIVNCTDEHGNTFGMYEYRQLTIEEHKARMYDHLNQLRMNEKSNEDIVDLIVYSYWREGNVCKLVSFYTALYRNLE